MNAYIYAEEKERTDALLKKCYDLLGRLDMFPDQEIAAMKLREEIRNYQTDESA